MGWGGSAGVLQAAALLLPPTEAQPDHDALQAGLHDAQQGPLGGVAVPARLHQLPALLVEAGQTLGPGSWEEGGVLVPEGGGAELGGPHLS